MADLFTSRTHITYKERLKLIEAINKQWDSYVIAQRPTLKEAAKHFGKQLGLTLTAHIVGGSVKLAERNWPRGINRDPIVTVDGPSTLKASIKHQIALTGAVNKLLALMNAAPLVVPAELTEFVTK